MNSFIARKSSFDPTMIGLRIAQAVKTSSNPAVFDGSSDFPTNQWYRKFHIPGVELFALLTTSEESNHCYYTFGANCFQRLLHCRVSTNFDDVGDTGAAGKLFSSLTPIRIQFVLGQAVST